MSVEAQLRDVAEQHHPLARQKGGPSTAQPLAEQVTYASGYAQPLEWPNASSIAIKSSGMPEALGLWALAT